MISHRALTLAADLFHGTLLRTAALAVPGPQRSEWLREWSAELWHVRAACLEDPPDYGNSTPAFSSAAFWTAQTEITAFCLGAFPDAAALRRHAWPTRAGSARVHGSARHCLLALASIAGVCAMVAQLLPGVRNEGDASHAPQSANLVVIGEADGLGPLRPAISVPQYQLWKSHHQDFFSRFAFFRVEEIHADLPGIPHLKWTVAQASADLFPLLGMAIAHSEPPDPFRPRAVLSQAAWRTWFHADPDIVGAVLPLGNRKVQIAGIAPAATWRIPGDPDVFLLDSETALARGQGGGYLLASLPSGGFDTSGHPFNINATGPKGADLILRADPIVQPASGPAPIYLFALFLAILALPAITAVSASDNHFTSHRPSRRARLNRYALLSGKVVLVAVIAWFAGLDLAYAPFPDFSPVAEFLQFATTFLIALFGLRWAIRDQSHRCPVCLRHVTHPAQVGIASCTFLGWNGTELICTAGHALLHVPSLPTSWFSHQRWTYLDPTWDFLFADTTLQP